MTRPSEHRGQDDLIAATGRTSANELMTRSAIAVKSTSAVPTILGNSETAIQSHVLFVGKRTKCSYDSTSLARTSPVPALHGRAPRTGSSWNGTSWNGTSRGFTLIELLIVVVIVGVLARIAYPSYQKYLIRTSREAAQSQLLGLASSEEKIFLNSSAYTSSVTTAYTGAASGGLGVPSGKTNDNNYSLSVAATTTTFTLTATPVGGSTQAGDGNITITESGIRTWGATTW